MTLRQFPVNSQRQKEKQLVKKMRWHKTDIRVQVADTDYGGGVYHGRYFALYHQARDQFLDAIGVCSVGLQQQGFDLTVAELHTFFVKPVFYKDRLEVNTRLVWYREKSMGVAQEMMGTDPGTALCTLRNQVTMNLVCTCRGKAVPLPKALIRGITSFYGL